ncbi:MAG: hypothetical protein ACOCXM_07860 [Myxococcota bacterium]
MFVREVVTGQKEGRPVRYAQIVASYRNAQGKPRHKVVLSLGRVDRLDRPQLLGLVRALVRYLGDGDGVPRPQPGRVCELGLPWAAHAVWTRLSLPEHLRLEAHRHGLDEGSERALFARVLALLACEGSVDRGASWLATEAFPLSPEGESVPREPGGEDLLAQAGPDLERGLFLRRAIPDGRVFAMAWSIGAHHPPCAIACDADGVPLVSHVAPTPDTLGRRLHRRLRDLGARDVVWGEIDGPGSDGEAASWPPPVLGTLSRVRRTMATASAGTEETTLESARTRLTEVLLAARVGRRLELDADAPFARVRELLRTVRAVELRDGPRVRWESATPSPEAVALLRRLGLGDLPRDLPDPG